MVLLPTEEGEERRPLDRPVVEYDVAPGAVDAGWIDDRVDEEVRGRKRPVHRFDELQQR